MTFTIKILGAGSATPLKGRHHSAQLVSLNEHKYLIDCGEGTQYRLIEEKMNINKIEVIFISHLHGDHYYGLVGLISTMSLLGRKNSIQVFGPAGLNDIITLNFKISNTVLAFDLFIHELTVTDEQKIYEDNYAVFYSFPLNHGIQSFGYLAEEKPGLLKLVKERISDLSVEEMVMLKNGKNVSDVHGNIKFDVKTYTYPPEPVRKYAYCSDTIYEESILPYIQHVDLLYHEATYLEEHKEKAIRNNHATAMEAALIAKKANVKKLMIGHLSSRYEDYESHLSEAKSVFFNTIPAIEGKTITI